MEHGIRRRPAVSARSEAHVHARSPSATRRSGGSLGRSCLVPLAVAGKLSFPMGHEAEPAPQVDISSRPPHVPRSSVEEQRPSRKTFRAYSPATASSSVQTMIAAVFPDQILPLQGHPESARTEQDLAASPTPDRRDAEPAPIGGRSRTARRQSGRRVKDDCQPRLMAGSSMAM